MAQKKLTDFTDEELLQEGEKMKKTKLYDSLIVGFLVGVALFSTYNNGFGVLTFLPVVYIPIAGKNKTKIDELEKLLTERNLK